VPPQALCWSGVNENRSKHLNEDVPYYINILVLIKDYKSAFVFVILIYVRISAFLSTTEVLQTDMHNVKVHAIKEFPCVKNDLLIHCVTVAFKYRSEYSPSENANWKNKFLTYINLSWKHKYKQTLITQNSKAYDNWMERNQRKIQLTDSSPVLSHVLVKVPVFWPWILLQKSSGVAILVSLQESLLSTLESYSDNSAVTYSN